MIEEIIKLTGCELVDRKYQGENSMCCGSGIFPTQKERAITTDESKVQVFVIPTDEEGVIARDTYKITSS